MVWEETNRIVNDLLDDVWNDATEVAIKDAVDFTIPIAIFVISAAGAFSAGRQVCRPLCRKVNHWSQGFGQRATWHDNRIPPTGHKMTFKDAIHTLCAELITVMSTPKWAMGLNDKLRVARLSVDEMHVRTRLSSFMDQSD